MQTLKLVTEEEKQPTLHAGRADSPELGVQGMQQLFDAHPSLNTARMNENVGIQNANNATVQAHLDSKANPHGVTKAQVGLEKADNTSDMEKPVSTAQAAAIALKADKTYTDTQDAATLTGAKAYADTLAFGAGAVMSVFGRAGAVTAKAGDYTAAQVGADPTGAAQSAVAAHATQPLHTTALTHAKAATVHTLTGLTASAGVVQASFTATADYMAGDTFQVGAVPYTAKLQGEDGALTDKYFVTGDLVSVLIDVGGKRLGFSSSGGGSVSGMIKVKQYNTLPAKVENNIVAIITSSPMASYFVDTRKPLVATAGDIWVQQYNTDNTLIQHDGNIGTLSVRFGLAKQLMNGSWRNRNAYIGINNAWIKISDEHLVYGCKIDKGNSDPLTRVSYTDSALGMKPCGMNYVTGEFDYGDWYDFITELATPVMLNYNGSVAYELDRNNQTKKADGTLSDISDPNFSGNAMVKMKKIYTKAYSDGQYDYFKFSFDKIDDSYSAYAFTNQNGIEQDFAFMPMFRGSSIAGKMRSIAGKVPLAGLTCADEISLASANGTGYYTQYWSIWNLKMQLLFLVGRSTDSQLTFGNGNVSGTDPLNTGLLKDKGAFYGYGSFTNQVKCFYSEVMWGDQQDRIMGCMTDGSNNIKVKMYPPYNETGSNYIVAGVCPGNAYLRDADFSEKGMFPKSTTGGSATTYFSDMFNGGANRHARVGGDYISGASCGCSCLLLYTFTTIGAGFVASLFYVKP